MKLKIKKKTTLDELDNGSLFLSENKKELCMKTEYHVSNGASESFIVNDGCMYWGGTNSAREQLALVVWEIEVVDEYKDILYKFIVNCNLFN